MSNNHLGGNIQNSVLIEEHEGDFNAKRSFLINMALQLEYDGNSNPIYIGIAAPGSLTSEAKWQIRKLTFDVSNNVTSIQYANGSPNFDAIYDNRVSLSYS